MSREASFTMSQDDEDMCSSHTPYRLPRLSPNAGDQTPNSEADIHDDLKSPDDKVWSRYGYEKIIK